jgi:hypothetical protein
MRGSLQQGLPVRTLALADERDDTSIATAIGPVTSRPDNRWVTQATFETAGTYLLRCLASDGALDAAHNITVVVTR